MAHLLQTNQLQATHVEFYLAYTVHIFDLAQRYEWETLLDFDYQYRERQVEFGFEWGTNMSNMELTLLRSRRWGEQGGHGQKREHHKLSTGGAVVNKISQPQQDCRLFKNRNGNCPYGDSCKFRHVQSQIPKKRVNERSHYKFKYDGSLNYEQWEKMLPVNDSKREWILKGVHEGFENVDSEPQGEIEIYNHTSATNKLYRPAVEKQIMEEITNGRYRVVNKKTKLISALAAIPKQDGKIRLIHDASQPTGGALNDYAEKGQCVYESVKDAIKIIKPNSFMGKIDLSNAYRTVKIHPRHQQWTGLKWRFDGDDHFTYMIDERLCFGARKSPSIFTQLTQAVIRILANMGHSGIACYLDDFLIVADTHAECVETMSVLQKTLRALGFHINYKKIHIFQ